MKTTLFQVCWALSFGIALAADFGCSSKVCTAIGCGLPFAVDFQPSSGLWPPGTYAIEVVADGSTGRCEVTLPLAPCGATSSTCTGTRDWGAIESGCALPASQQSVPGIVFSTTPVDVEVALGLNGRELGRKTFAPSYQMSYPN